VVAAAVAAFATHHLPAVRTHKGDLVIIAAGSVVWAAVAFGVLVVTKSSLPQQLLRRRKA